MNFSSAILWQTIAVLVIHEVGHLAAAAGLGVRVKRVGITWWGAPFIVREAGTPLQNAVVSLAGPLANLACLPAVALWIHLAHRVPGAWWFCVFSLAQGIWNVLPVPASDGLRACKAMGVCK